jgi:hypothetical protein
MTLTDRDRAALHQAADAIHAAAELIQTMQRRHLLDLSGATITVATMAIHDFELFERRLLEEAR